MSEAKQMEGHTPGPWWFDDDWHRLPTVFGSDHKTHVCIVEKGTCSRDALPSQEHRANARLIASAPDLLADNGRLRALNAEMLAALQGGLRWAQSRCPCYHESSDPCPLCGATVKAGRCKAVEEIFPTTLLEEWLAIIAKAKAAGAQTAEG